MARLDLNLLRVFDALMAERHVSRAAARLGRSQPAVSHALSKLRRHFGDALLVRNDGAMAPTPRALELGAAVRRALSELDAATAPETSFDPARAKRSFRLAMSDYNAHSLLPPLMTRLRLEAPGIDLVVHHAGRTEAPDMVAKGDIDLAVGVFPRPPEGVDRELLFRDRMVCIARRGRVPARGVGLERFRKLPHLLVSFKGEKTGVEQILGPVGKGLRYALIVEHFSSVGPVVAVTDLVAILSERIARRFAAQYDLVIFPPPMALEEVVVSQIWHRRHEDDRGHRWMRELVRQSAHAAVQHKPEPETVGAVRGIAARGRREKSGRAAR